MEAVAFLTPIFYSNNVVPLALGVYLISDKISLEQSAKSPPMIQVMEARQIRSRQVDVTWIEGPTGTQTNSKFYMHLGSTQGPTGQSPGQKLGASGAHMGSTKPWVWPNHHTSHPSWPSMWWLPIGPKGDSGVFAVSLCSEPGCSKPINRRGKWPISNTHNS